MKVTIEPNGPSDPYSNVNHPTVTISVPDDDLDVDQALNLVHDALIAWGFSPGLVCPERYEIKHELEKEAKEDD